MPEPGGPLAPPIFDRSVNPIRTGEGRLSPPITTGPLNVFHLPASLDKAEIQVKTREQKKHDFDYFLTNVIETGCNVMLNKMSYLVM